MDKINFVLANVARFCRSSIVLLGIVLSLGTASVAQAEASEKPQVAQSELRYQLAQSTFDKFRQEMERAARDASKDKAPQARQTPQQQRAPKPSDFSATSSWGSEIRIRCTGHSGGETVTPQDFDLRGSVPTKTYETASLPTDRMFVLLDEVDNIVRRTCAEAGWVIRQNVIVSIYLYADALPSRMFEAGPGIVRAGGHRTDRAWKIGNAAADSRIREEKQLAAAAERERQAAERERQVAAPNEQRARAQEVARQQHLAKRTCCDSRQRRNQPELRSFCVGRWVRLKHTVST